MKILELEHVSRSQSIHGIYPYRGKISSLDASRIIKQLPKGSTLLDPFCGSGTILFEGVTNGLNVFGVDNNPLAYILSKGKMNALDESLDRFTEEARNVISKSKSNCDYPNMPSDTKIHFHEKTSIEVMSVARYFDQMSDYLKANFLGAVALTARACNHYKWTSSTVGKDINPKKYVCFYDKFLDKIVKHYPTNKIKHGTFKIFLGDSRKLSNYISPNSIDYVFTSPPYFDCLDYTAYYGKIVFTILGYDRKKIRENLIQTTKTYKKDMELVLKELIKATKDTSLLIFVVGDKKTKEGIIKGNEFFSDLLIHKPNQVVERSYTKSSSQIFDKLNKTTRSEQIVIWDRKTW
jgi:DNA modification methylase